MDSEELYTELNKYFPNNLDLMRYLHVNACWEYVIFENSTYEENPKLHYYLYKKDESTLVMTKEDPGIIPDLILFFTENIILNLVHGNPNADEYYTRYRQAMSKPKSSVEIDSKINKPRLKLLKLGYRNWQKDFKF